MVTRRNFLKQSCFGPAAFLLLSFPFACGEEARTDWADAADRSARVLLQSFWNADGNYFNYDSDGNTEFHYWPQAHALDVLVDAYTRTGDEMYKNCFDRWFEGVRVENGDTFRNDFYDDMEWNALAILRAWKATNDVKYKAAALEIWEYIKEGWNDNAGGGIAWVKGQEYSKNACSNGPACILAARLYREFGDEENRAWAVRIYNWEKSTLFNAVNGTVCDNINSETGETNRDWIFTYNQGTFTGSAVELYRIFGERSYLDDAVRAADYTIVNLVDSAVLKSEGPGDGGLFKGIFVRYFAELIRQDGLDAATRKRYLRFLRHNAETLWNEGTTPSRIFYGPDWRTPPGDATGLTEQLSGSMLIEAAALLLGDP
jgi:predicted alpha-1,6-mannanase (GH76 family)